MFLVANTYWTLLSRWLPILVGRPHLHLIVSHQTLEGFQAYQKIVDQIKFMVSLR